MDAVWLNTGTTSNHPLQSLGNTQVPEPSVLALCGLGLLLLRGARIRPIANTVDAR